MKASQTTHQKFGWKAEHFFDDPSVIELCKAIEADDLKRIQQMIDAGVDVNAEGKGNMTPLRWAYPDNKPERFEMLLKAGADPNVAATSDLGVPKLMFKGSTVTHWACSSSFNYFDAVFNYGGDPNLPDKTKLGGGRTPIFSVIESGGQDLKKRIKRLLELGADIDRREPEGTLGRTPAMFAAARFGQYDICIFLLENGADPSLYQTDYLSKLTHVLARADGILKMAGPQQKADYKRLVAWLEERGESVVQAKEDKSRYRSFIRNYNDYERKKRFAAEAAKNEQRWLEQRELKKNLKKAN